MVCNEAWPASCWTSRSDPAASETFLAAPVFDHPAGRYPAKTAPFITTPSPRRSTLRTVVASQTRPRGVLTPRALSALATPDSDVTPAPWTSRMMGRTFRAKASALALVAAADVILSHHPAHAITRRLPPSADNWAPPGITGWPKFNGDGLPPSLQLHYRAFITTTRQSAPLRHLGTFGLAVVTACAFSLGIAGQVLTFRTRAWLSFAPPTCRMPSRPAFRSAPGLIPEEGSPPGFDIV